MPTPLILVPQSVLLQITYPARLQEFVLRWPIVPEVAPRGPGFARGVWLFEGSFVICPFCVCVCVRACVRAWCVCVCVCV